MEDKDLRKVAKERVSFKIHLTVYAAVIAFLAWLNYSTSPGYWWFLWVAFGWGIAILFHGLSAYVWDIGMEEREYQKLKRNQAEKKKGAGR
jgi:hypothetical protein